MKIFNMCGFFLMQIISFIMLVNLEFVVANSIKYSENALLDQIVELPGLNYHIKFNHFSGYLDLVNTTKHIHYWYVESESKPETDPLVFWTNGGPGCSGLIGFMTEQGPFRPKSDGLIEPNKWSWNKISNMVFLEQPTGVGFSYSSNSSEYKIGDEQSAKDNLQIILEFLERFPHLKSNPLYITSESYGGHYMPELSIEIINYNKNVLLDKQINFAGMAVGNPYVDYYSGSGAQMETYNNFNLLPKPLWNKYIDEGCINPLVMLNNSICTSYFIRFSQLIGNLNPYALEFPICVQAQQSKFSDYLFDRNIKYMEENYKLNFSPNTYLHNYVPLSENYEPCIDNYANEYLNNLDVKIALHVDTKITWTECSKITKYELGDKFKSTIHHYKQILNEESIPEFKMMIYTGDVDGVCGSLYTQEWIFNLGFNYEQNYLWKNWKVDGMTSGYITKFKTPYSNKSRLTFATVHDAGHEVPTYKPKEAFVLFKAFLNDNWNI